MKRESWLSSHSFDPAQYVDELQVVIPQLECLTVLTEKAMHRILAKHPKDARAMFSKFELIRGARYLAEHALWAGDYEAFVEKVQVKPIRTQSGVTPITVLTRPWPCPGKCIFCPDDPAMPKSYLSMEPGAQRAERYRFDPFEQTTGRLRTVDSMGHGVEKVELIVLGGTWSSYPRAYQLWFTTRLFDALNDFEPHIMAPLGSSTRASEPETILASDASNLEPWRGRDIAELEASLLDAQRRNERAHARCVGYTLETRPDHVTESEVTRLRTLGTTRVQLGYQSTSDEILRLNGRGHSVEASRAATALLRRGAFKIQAHWMANLYGSDPESDIRDFERLFSDPALRPDELKLYPCMLVAGTELEETHRQGLWHPYSEEELTHVLAECLTRVPRYCRVNRVIRDIPGQDLLVGIRVNGLRGAVEARVADSGNPSDNIRRREIRRRVPDPESLKLSETRYATTASEEVFIEFVTGQDELAGFLRLSLPSEKAFIPELEGAALIREVHVYGTAVGIGSRHDTRSQHMGLGTRLVRRAETLARQAGYETLAVISAVGTRDYYRGLGFRDGKLYQHLAPRQP